MKKRALMALPNLTATDEMKKIATSDLPRKEKTDYGYVREVCEYYTYLRCIKQDGILKVAFFFPEHLRLDGSNPAYEVYLDKEKRQFITYNSLIQKWSESKLDRLDWKRQYWYTKAYWISDEDETSIQAYLNINKKAVEAIRQFQQKYRGVSVDVLGDQDEVILADVQHLGEAVYNLLTNAHEAFLVSGKTEKEILQIILHSERFYIGFEIRDNGNGIAEKERQKIFYPFYTSKNTNNNWGMGLYYVREIVKGHFGMMKMESVPGEGTSFCMMIPRYEPRKRLNLKWKRGEV